MNDAVTYLPSMAELLDLEEIDRDLYRGTNEVPDNGRPRLFGGQVAAQALKAAGMAVPDGRSPHSMHGYFLRPGLRNRPVNFRVERDRDGRSFSARRVSAVQPGEVIFDLTASFHVDEVGSEYSMPITDNVPGPEVCSIEAFAVWFRAPVSADRWILHHMWPLMAVGARGLYAGSMHQADGTLGAMITQESLRAPR